MTYSTLIRRARDLSLLNELVKENVKDLSVVFSETDVFERLTFKQCLRLFRTLPGLELRKYFIMEMVRTRKFENLHEVAQLENVASKYGIKLDVAVNSLSKNPSSTSLSGGVFLTCVRVFGKV